MSAQELTQMLNGGTPRPAETSAPVAPAARPVATPAAPVAAARPAPTPAAARAPVIVAPTQRDLEALPQAARDQTLNAPASPLSEVVRPTATAARAAAIVEDEVVTTAPAEAVEAEPARTDPVALTAAAIAALPFHIELSGAQIIERQAGPDAKVYSVRRGNSPLLMIYAGPQSQFPIFDGEQVIAGGRASVVLQQGVRRMAVEHLFQNGQREPAEVHIWLITMDGADGEMAERIGQSVDPK